MRLNLLSRIRRWLGLEPKSINQPTCNDIHEIKKPSIGAKVDEESRGVCYFRKRLLHRLDEFFIILERMKKSDREAYDLFSRIGIRLVPFGSYKPKIVSPWWLETMPAFGAIAIGVGSDYREFAHKEGKLVPKLVYFTKYKSKKHPKIIQPTIGDVYVVTVYWDNPEDSLLFSNKKGVPWDFPAVILPDGSVKVLKVLDTKYNAVIAKRGKDRGTIIKIPQRRWSVHKAFHDWSKEHNMNVYDFLAEIFLTATGSYEIAMMSSPVMVRAGKSGVIGSFGIDLKRSSYFFRDRDVSISDGTKRKKIFHAVRAHERIRGNRKEAVRLHFRGERHFMWNGYQIDITIPGLHHADLADANFGTVDMAHIKPEDRRQFIDRKRLADEISNHLNSERDTLKSYREKTNG